MTGLEDIIKLCIKNDRSAQSKLYAWLSPTLLGIALRYMQQRDEAEDVMQDSFVKIFTHLKDFKNEGSFEGWAKRITVNTALTALKKNKTIKFERGLSIVESIDFSVEDTQEIQLEEVFEAMRVLPVGYRTILNMYLVEEFSHKEIGEQLGIQESSSRSQYTRARQALLKIIKDKKNLQITGSA